MDNSPTAGRKINIQVRRFKKHITPLRKRDINIKTDVKIELKGTPLTL